MTAIFMSTPALETVKTPSLLQGSYRNIAWHGKGIRLSKTSYGYMDYGGMIDTLDLSGKLSGQIGGRCYAPWS